MKKVEVRIKRKPLGVKLLNRNGDFIEVDNTSLCLLIDDLKDASKLIDKLKQTKTKEDKSGTTIPN